MLGFAALGEIALGQGGSERRLVAEPGIFTVTGQDAILAASITFTAEPGVFQLNGQDAKLSRGFRLAAAPGIFSVSGQDISGSKAYRLAAERGMFSLSGQDLASKADRVLRAEAGVFEVFGQDIDFGRTFGATGIKHLHRAGNPIGARSASLAPIRARHGYLRASAR